MSHYYLSSKADADLEQIAHYIGQQHHTLVAADEFIDNIHIKLSAYSRQPEMGEMRDDLEEGLRSFPFKKNYVVIYRPLEDGIDVLRIFHGARNYGQFFGE